MASKVFETLFKLNAKYLGGPAFGRLNTDIDRTQRNLKGAQAGFTRLHGSVTKFAGAIGVTALAYKALAKASQFWHMGVDASREAIDLQEKLGVSSERLAKKYGQSSKEIADSVSATSKAIADFGFDTEDVTAGVTKLAESMGNTRQLQSFSQAFANITAKTKGAKPGIEGFQQSAEEINSAIRRGRSPLFKQLEWTDKQTKAFKKMTVEQRRLYLAQYGMNQLAGEAARVMGTTAGKVAKADKAYEDLGQAVAGGAVENQAKIAESMTKFYEAALPAAEAVGKQLAPAFDRWAKLLADNGPQIAKIVENIASAVLKIPDVAVWVMNLFDKIPVLFDLPKHWPAIKKFFTDLWANTEKEFAMLWPVIERFGVDLWANTLKEWETLKGIVAWIDENIIKPISALFDWLVTKIQQAWALIQPIWEKMNAPVVPRGTQVTPTTPQAMDWRYGGGSTGSGTYPQDSGSTPVGGWGTPMNPRIQKAAEAGAATSSKSSGVLGGVLAGKEGAFEAAGAKHGVDPKLLMAIAEFETGHGKSYSARTRNNIAGIMSPKDPSRHMVYGSIEEGIDAQASLLKRGYISQGRTTIPQIGAKYSPPGASNDPNRTNSEWPSSVQREYDRINAASSPSLGSMTRGIGGPKAGAQAPINVTMASPITINGVSADKTGAVGQEVVKAMQDPSRRLVAEIKKARADRYRLDYV